MNKIAILGAGAWGTALAKLFARHVKEVILWAYEPEVAKELATQRTNQTFLPDIILPQNVTATSVIAHACQDADVIVEAIPMMHLASVIKQLEHSEIQSIPLIITSKGVITPEALLPSQFFVLHGWSIDRLLVCVGPTFAKEVVREQHSGFLLASKNSRLIQAVNALIASPCVTTCMTDDLIGAQIGGALKNVIALGIGMLMGAGGGENSRALAVVKGFQEMLLYAALKGGSAETIQGYAGLGDLLLTCMSQESKNFRTGFLRGQGRSIDQIIQLVGLLPEGCNTIRLLDQSSTDFAAQFPFLDRINGVFWGGNDPKCLETIL
jgi:glycerol-3-phosphate dehydrogenase (NAD(P)+)